jgi:hypothetical protein
MTVGNWISDREVITIIKDSLQNNLTDPREQYTNDSRSWVHTDSPLTSATFPRIQVRKRGPTSTNIISMGRDFVEWRALILDIQIWVKSPFQWKTDSNTYLKNEELVKYYQDVIWKTLKSQQQTLHTTYGITGLKPVEEPDAFHEPDNQFYSGIVSVRVWYFRKI